MGPVCGNGQLDPGEVCDDGNQLDNDCCISGCQVLLRRGTLCGDPALGECDNGDTCDSSGHCLANPKPFGTQCTDDGEPCTADQCDGAGTCSHPPGNAGTVCYEATDPCEMDAVCDGESPDCRVDTSGCTGEVKPPPPQGKTIEVDCTAQDTVQGQASTCEAVGFVAGAGASAIVSNARASTIRPDPGEGSRVTKRKKRTLEPGPTGGGLTVLRGRLKLKLNATGRKLLNRQRVLNVSVHVAIHHGTTIRNIKRLVQLIR